MTKTCSKCGKTKPLDAFYSGRQSWCKRCADEGAKRRRIRNRVLVLEAKGQLCVDCGGRFPPECMDFDHVRGKKHFEIGSRKALTCGAKLLLTEIAKCNVVCANCHRIRTHGC